MNWEAIAAIGQMLGSIAVFVTLAYLGVQIRHTSQDVPRSVNRSGTESVGATFAVRSRWRRQHRQSVVPHTRASCGSGFSIGIVCLMPADCSGLAHVPTRNSSKSTPAVAGTGLGV